MSAAFIASVIVWGVFVVATWDIENKWKRWCLLIVAMFSILVMGEIEYQDGACDVYKQIDAQENVTIKNIPEDCE